MSSLPPRAVLITRETDYERLLHAHATVAQAAFFLRTRSQSIETVQTAHERFRQTVNDVRAAIPEEWRVARVDRDELDRFLFTPEDIVLAVGQDGLVANVAKYLSGQPVLGINPAPDQFEGVLVPLNSQQAPRLMVAAAEGRASLEKRTMVRAELDDGQVLEALNEVFIGHHSHQSARYMIRFAGEEERHSSSGVIVSSGTGATGWARSLSVSTGHSVSVSPTDPRLAFFVREPWPSVATGATIAFGEFGAETAFQMLSNMNEGGVIFADGVEQDHLSFGWGRTVSVGPSQRTLNLVRS